LIELGFENPKNIVEGELYSDIYFAYSIGELIEMLPISFETDNDDTSWLEIEAGAVWSVSYSSFGFIDYDCEREELIDALFDMILKLKEEGVI
jgi:hypothetical protein